MNEDSQGQFMRAAQLIRLRRYPEAESALCEILSQNPNDAFLLHHLAVAQFNQEGKEKTALKTIEQAIGCDPADSDNHAFRAIVLRNLERGKDALAAANEAISLEPSSSFAFVAKASALMGLSRHAEAETAAREALSLDPDNGSAANLLSHALRIQGKSAENEGRIAAMLARDPEDDDNHVAAGWQALQSGKREDAQKHFMEALRLNPENELAREGMLETFKARSPFYRTYLKWAFWMASQSQGRQWAVMIGFFFLMKSFRSLRNTSYATIGAICGGLLWLLIMWTHVARGVGNFLVLLDRMARHALTKRQRWEAIFVGGGVFAGALIVAVSFCFKTVLPEESKYLAIYGLIPGATLIAASFPFAYTFTNDAPVGRWIMAAAGAFIIMTGVTIMAGMAFDSRELVHLGKSMIAPALLSVFFVTLLANVRFFHR